MTNDRTFEQLAFDAGRVFTPAVPVSEDALFAGRMDQIRRIVDVVNQRGQHVAIFGERGVGKTSLANIISSKLTAPGFRILAPRINCDGRDDFAGLWSKVVSQLALIKGRRSAGFQVGENAEAFNIPEHIGETAGPDDVRRLLTDLGENHVVIIILDEFDRLTDRETRRAVADTIKSLSDFDVPATLVVVGVADNVEDLVAEHQSIERALVQVQMPRMNRAELHEILNIGTKRLGMRIKGEARQTIAHLSHGLPHYTHLLGLHAVRAALDAGQRTIGPEHVRIAIAKAVMDAEQSLRSGYRKAITSPQKDNIFGEVLLACAMAEMDDFGFFPAAHVRGPLSMIRGRPYEIPSFARHLNEFCQDARGPILKKSGEKRKFRYRFVSPLMPPLIIMKGIVDERIDEGALSELQGS